MLYQELTSVIISCAFEVHKTLGCGFYEKIYHNALLKELKNKGMTIQSEAKIDVFYKGDSVGVFYADIIVNDKIILELKSTEKVTYEHRQQILNYLKASKFEVGMLLNFGEKSLYFKRFISTIEK